MKIAVVKYNAGNIQSVLYALERIGCSAKVTDDPEELLSADKVIFPGVGEAGSAMRSLQGKNLDVLLKSLTQPVLGVCVGMQLMCRHSEEGNTDGIGIFPEEIKRFSSGSLKVPQIGWNNIYDLKTTLFAGIEEQSFVYLVHGFYASIGKHTIAKTQYGQAYSTALHLNNFYGVQFHPEKSADVGEQILRNFIFKI